MFYFQDIFNRDINFIIDKKLLKSVEYSIDDIINYNNTRKYPFFISLVNTINNDKENSNYYKISPLINHGGIEVYLNVGNLDYNSKTFKTEIKDETAIINDNSFYVTLNNYKVNHKFVRLLPFETENI
jgi:hypothetical protein